MLTLATFNINSVTKRLGNLVTWLEREEPDIVCLQELKTTTREFPRKEIEALGYRCLVHGEPNWNGVAILCKGAEPIETRRALPGQEKDPHARYLEAAVRGVIVGCIYAPNGNPITGPKFVYKQAWFESLITHAEALFATEHPVVLAGDYNVVPTDFDIYDPKSWKRNALLSTKARQQYERLVAQGWTDALRTLNPDTRIYTFWDYFREHWKRNAGLRIDHFLLSKVLAPALKDGGVHTWVRDQPTASDHAPTWITLRT
ncbi:exodeoxyribonuclease III [soil metagenome]